MQALGVLAGPIIFSAVQEGHVLGFYPLTHSAEADNPSFLWKAFISC